jgi:hypothetical protein
MLKMRIIQRKDVFKYFKRKTNFLVQL